MQKDSYFNKVIETSQSYDVSSTIKSVFRDHSLKSSFKHSSKNLKAGEVDILDF